MKKCNACKRDLDHPDDPVGTKDCGGDCCGCLARAGDPDCQKALRDEEIRRWELYRDRQISQLGYYINGVSGLPPFAYSVGLAGKLGYEIAVVNVGEEGVFKFLLEVAGRLTAGENLFDGPFTMNGYSVLVGMESQHSRVKFVELALDSPTASNFFGILGKTPKIFHLIASDAKNVLPGEPGYDVTYIQELEQYAP